ncbi:MAG: phosphoribosyltransferase [Herpetosiphon sp.]
MRPVISITWQQFDQLARVLAEQVQSFDPQLILGITRGGLFPATLLAFTLRRELYPVRLAQQQSQSSAQPLWLVPPPTKVRGRRVLVVHEVAESGRTLALATAKVREMGASHVRSAALYSHTWANPRPDYVAFTSDALILSPWDREILTDGHWVTHPELTAALQQKATGTPVIASPTVPALPEPEI